MDEMDDSVDEETGELRSPPFSEREMVWSVGELCQAKWSGDDQLYMGTIRKMKHLPTGRAVALVKFMDYYSDDCEEVDVQQLQRVAKQINDGRKEETNQSKDKPDDECTTGGSGFFKPLTSSEEISRLEEKYGYESDSDCEERLESAQWMSSSTYKTQGKVSEWTVKSPGKPSAPSSQRHKSPVVQMQSPRKRAGTTRRTRQTEKNEEGKVACSDSAQVTAKGTSPSSSAVRGEMRDSAEGNCAGHTTKDSDYCLTIGEGLFEGFDEDDMEKPQFSFPAPSEKVPFCLDDSQNVQIPAPLNQYLRDYQREGVQFLYSHYRHTRGAVLGDDMGLGKTVQVIGFLSALMRKKGNRQDVLRHKPRFIRLMSDSEDIEEEKTSGPVLIIGPGSVLYNWLEELDTWAHFTVRKYHGADKASCLVDVSRGKVEVVVTTFETCRDNIDALNTVNWDAVIVDEVHRIKGLKAQTTKALRTLKCARRYGLTGTALQNNMSELWCILDWAQPNVLGSAEDFEEDFVRPIELGQKQNATKRELAVARKKKEEFAGVRQKMMLRRTKKLIADQLPVKTDRVVFCRLAPLQISVYKAVLSHPGLKVVLCLNEACSCGSGLSRGRCCYKKLKGARSPRSVMFTFMHVLLKASNHVALLTPHARMSSDQVKQAQHLCKIAFKDHPEFTELARDAAFRTLSDPKYCGKMKVLHGMLSVFAKDHSKVLVFSYSTRLLDILEQHVMSEGFDYRRIDGSITGRRRQDIVREFNSNPDIFLCLVSTKAGGLGLNMTGANKVVIFDPNWNPSHDLQAQDRAYRIGQRRDVEVYRLISAGSIEENIYLRQIYKQQLGNVAVATENARRYFKGIQGDEANKGELFGMKNMFRLRTGDSCLTMDILSRNAKMEAGIAGHDVADYIPSWREQHDMGDDSVQESDDGGGNSDESSDEETLKAFKDLFEIDSDDEEKDNQPEAPRTSNPELPASGLRRQSVVKDPLPSTSGLQKQTRPTTRSAESLDSCTDSLSETTTRWSKHTTRQRKRVNTDDGVGWSEETSVTETLSFLEDGDERAAKKGKALRLKKPGVVCDGKRSDSPRVPVTSVKDSLVTPTFSSVSSVFEEYGVVHVHANPQVVGASRVEDHMSRCAMHDVFELGTNTQAPALACDPMSQPSDEEDQEASKTTAASRKGQRGKGARGRTPFKDHNTARVVDHGCWHLLVGQTPTAIRKKQWSQLKKLKNSPDEITLATQVLVASPEQRLAMLKQLYKSDHKEELHDTLDSILSSLEGQNTLSGGQRSQEGQSTARTSSVPHQTNTAKKTKSQSRAASGKKAVTRRKRRAPGLLYADEDDTQLSQARQMSTACLEDDPDGEDSGFDITTRVTPRKVRATQIRQRGRPGRSRLARQSVTSPSLFDRRGEEPGPSSTVLWEDAVKDKIPGAAGSLETEDVAGLLSELGRKASDGEAWDEVDQRARGGLKPPCAGGGQHSSASTVHITSSGQEKSKLSVLDDLFDEPEHCQVKKRKPPPSRGHRPTGVTNRPNPPSDPYLAGDAGSSRLCDARESHAQSGSAKRSSASSSDIFSDLMNNSTLRDDDVDCFGEPSQWKRRHKTRPSPVKKAEQLLQKSSDDYLQLFETGRLVKKRPREKVGEAKKNVINYTDIAAVCDRQIRKDSSDLDPSGSLFS